MSMKHDTVLDVQNVVGAMILVKTWYSTSTYNVYLLVKFSLLGLLGSVNVRGIAQKKIVRFPGKESNYATAMFDCHQFH